MGRKRTVLIAARDDLVSALLGLLVELRGFEARFAGTGETCVAAARRLQPDLIVIDVDHKEVCADDFFTFATALPTSVVLFSAGRPQPDVREIAHLRHVESFAFPVSAAEIGALIEQVLGQ